MAQPIVVLYGNLDAVCEHAVRNGLQRTEFYMIVEADDYPTNYVLALVEQPYNQKLYNKCEQVLSEMRITNNGKNTLSQMRGHARYINHIKMNDIPHAYTSYYQH